MSTSNDIQNGASKSFLPIINGINQFSFVDEDERGKTLLATYALVSRLETPWVTVCRLAMAQVKCIIIKPYQVLPLTLSLEKSQPALGASLKVVKDLELFERWHERGDVALTYAELSALVSCDSLLLRTIILRPYRSACSCNVSH